MKRKFLKNFAYLNFIGVIILLQSNLGFSQNCTCSEYVYLNEPSSGSVHKYLVNTDGTLNPRCRPSTIYKLPFKSDPKP